MINHRPDNHRDPQLKEVRPFSVDENCSLTSVKAAIPSWQDPPLFLSRHIAWVGDVCNEVGNQNGFVKYGRTPGYKPYHSEIVFHAPSLECKSMEAGLWGSVIERRGIFQGAEFQQKFLHVGPLVFCHPEHNQWAKTFSEYELPHAPLYVAEYGSSLFRFHEYSQVIIALLVDLGIEGKNIVDLGSGGGVLSLSSLHLGAQSVTLVDIDTGALINAEKILLRNKKDTDEHCRFFAQDLTNTPSITKIINTAGDKDNTVVVLNLGDWPLNYEINNQVLCPVLHQLDNEKPRYVILGGYNVGREWEDSAVIEPDVRAMRMLGYEAAMTATSVMVHNSSAGGSAILFERV